MSRTPVPAASECNCSALRRTTRVVTRLYDEALAPLGLGASQYAILATLDRSGPLILRELAAALVMDRSTVGHLLRPLEQRGLVTIEAGSADRRRREVALSDAGRALAKQAARLWASAQTRFEREVGAAEAMAMRAMLAQVAAAAAPLAARDEEARR